MPRERSDSRRRMVEAASRLFRERGYAATSMSDVVAASGAPRGSTYYLFPGGKEQLAVEAVDQLGTDVERRLRSLAATLSTPTDLVRGMAGMAAGGPGDIGVCLVAAIALDAASTSERLREACSRVYTRWADAFAEMLTDAGMAPDRARSCAALGVAAFEGALIVARTHHNPETAVLILNQLADQLDRELPHR